MEYSKIFRKSSLMQILTVALAMGLITACSNDQSADNQADDPADETTTQQTSPQQQQQQQMGDQQSASSETVYRYSCPEGHAEGGSNQPGNCSVCGTKLTHNQAFHQQQQQQMQRGQQGQAQQPNAQTKQQLKQKLRQQRQQAEPKTNAEGEKIFHYACPEGHNKGGAMKPGNCSVCGTKLVHNQTYHQK